MFVSMFMFHLISFDHPNKEKKTSHYTNATLAWQGKKIDGRDGASQADGCHIGEVRIRALYLAHHTKQILSLLCIRLLIPTPPILLSISFFGGNSKSGNCDIQKILQLIALV